MDDDSIFSHEERAIARRLREGNDLETIADDLGYDVAVVERARDRIRVKTQRALATLVQSPDVEDAVAELSEGQRADLVERLEE